MVCWSVCIDSKACKMSEPTEMLFGVQTWVATRNYILDWGPDPPMGRGI